MLENSPVLLPVLWSTANVFYHIHFCVDTALPSRRAKCQAKAIEEAIERWSSRLRRSWAREHSFKQPFGVGHPSRHGFQTWWYCRSPDEPLLPARSGPGALPPINASGSVTPVPQPLD